MSKRMQAISMVLLFILAMCPLAQASSDCDFGYSNYARAVQLHDMGDYDAALRHYGCALQEDPDDAVIPLLIANLHEDIAHASRAWSAVSSPSTAEILGLPPLSTWGGANQAPRVQDFHDLIVQDSPRHEPSPRWAVGANARMRFMIARRGNMLWLFVAAADMDLRLLAQRAVAKVATDEADSVARRDDSKVVDKTIKSARIFVRNLDWTRARIMFEQALDLAPNRLDIRCELGMVYRELGDQRAALRQFEMALAQDPIDSCAGPNRDALLQAMRDG